jgi:hypothetical protein
MKALTITQPWASLMAAGWKEIETRSWATRYRGELVIHAAKGFPKWARDLCGEPPFAQKLLHRSPDELPLGIGLCVVELIACISTDFLEESWDRAEEVLKHPVSEYERDFGDYSSGRFAWITRFIRPLHKQRPVRGALGLWEFTE